MPDILAAVFSSFAARCKNKQTIQLLFAKHADIWKNNVTLAEAEPDNVLNLRSRLQPKKSLICLSTFGDCPNKTNPDTSEIRPYSNSQLLALGQPLIATTQLFFPDKPTSRQFCVSLGKRQLRYRLCFFL
jgi:hypothetical protein